MLFTSNVFIFIFLPIVLVLYFIIKNRTYRNIILCLSSLIFYAWGEPKYIVLMLLSIIINYIMAIFIDKEKHHKKLLLILTIIIDLSLLIYFKYFNFLILQVNNILNLNVKNLNIVLPIGISFYTFQIISYIIDVYKNKVSVQKNIINLATYIALFPQLIAGPIVRYETIEKELTNRKENIDNFINGLKRFIIGFAKKIILANNMALIADTIYSGNLFETGTLLIWIAAISYTLQIYFDFSGYSDMAIGLGKMFGFNFLENFNYPYIANSITDFWRRWHISLSSWFKDYVYIPLGGNRCSKRKWIRNILLVWLLTGFWHGANWNFILWGLYYGIILLIEKLWLNKYLEKLPKIITHIITLLLIIIGWVIFRIENLKEILLVIKTLFIYKPSDYTIILNNYDLTVAMFYMIPAIILSTPIVSKIFNKITNKNIIFEGIGYIIYLIIFIISLSMLLSNSYNPFIYFRF